ncbi:MAG: hypothetical protein WCA32_05655 [Chromatiaceae bacterium]
MRKATTEALVFRSAMSSLVVLIGILILGVGLSVAALPGTLRTILRPFLEPRWLYWVSGLRVLVGGVLVIAAPVTRLPGFVLGLGVLLVLAGGSIPLLGEARVHRMVEWWRRQPDWMLRAWGTVGVLIGAILASAGL